MAKKNNKGLDNKVNQFIESGLLFDFSKLEKVISQNPLAFFDTAIEVSDSILKNAETLSKKLDLLSNPEYKKYLSLFDDLLSTCLKEDNGVSYINLVREFDKWPHLITHFRMLKSIHPIGRTIEHHNIERAYMIIESLIEGYYDYRNLIVGFLQVIEKKSTSMDKIKKMKYSIRKELFRGVDNGKYNKLLLSNIFVEIRNAGRHVSMFIDYSKPQIILTPKEEQVKPILLKFEEFRNIFCDIVSWYLTFAITISKKNSFILRRLKDDFLSTMEA